ncbi:hypothetical protein AAE250_09315 [Bacteroides sp. GD17]|jgi:hypothetical protein|uniref:DUF7309 domain-containing protein n=1 Tax=Bacteroides sp. GD17 TaxID=3139826 RepID=UPI0025FF706D|nr:hypothetical protein [uncultured Bacteroides sp.]
MILTDDMLAAALLYRETEVWSILTDSDIFAFRLSDGETGYCCVMGNGGEHLALGFYRGRKGFSSYLKTLILNDREMSHAEMLDLASTLDCINCDFMPAADMGSEVKKRIRNYAETHGMTIRRPKGWPDFTRHTPFKLSFGITCEEDARDITEALYAAIGVAWMLVAYTPEKLGFNERGDYPTMQGGRQVPYLIPNERGTYDWETTELPAFLPDEWDAPEFGNDILASVVKKLRKSGTLQVDLVYLPIPCAKKDSEEVYASAALICLDIDNMDLFPIINMSGGEERYKEMFAELVDKLRNSGCKPCAIEVVNEKTESFLKDFCNKCDIGLSRKKELPELEDARSFLLGNLMK